MRLMREDPWKLFREYNESDSLIKHGLAVEGVIRTFAAAMERMRKKWGIVGLLHDLDYEKYPEEHCVKTQEIMRERGIDEDYIHAVASHGYGLCCDVRPEETMEWVLYTIDELTGLVNAAALIAPVEERHGHGGQVGARKKFKDKHFAAGVDREVVTKGAEIPGIVPG